MIVKKVCVSRACCEAREIEMGRAYFGHYSKAYKEVHESVNKCPDCGGHLQSKKVRRVFKEKKD